MIWNNADSCVVNKDHPINSKSQIELYFPKIDLMNAPAVIFITPSILHLQIQNGEFT